MRLTQVRAIALTAAAFLALVPLRLCAAPDIALQMTVDTVVPAAGQPVQFTVTASNVGADDASGVQVTDQPPEELRSNGHGGVSEHRDVRRSDGRLVDRLAGRGCQRHTGHPRHRRGDDAAAVQRQCGGEQPRPRYADIEQSGGRGGEAKRGRPCVDLGVSANGIFVPPCSEARHLDGYVYVSNRGRMTQATCTST